MADFVITIDGPAASGKSTVARLLAARLGVSFLDTGAMYRAVTLAAMQAGVDINNEDGLLDILQNSKFRFKAEAGKMAVWLDGVDLTMRLRDSRVTANARYIASAPKLREKLVQMQRDFAAGEEKIVTEGRDQGTVAFPNADIKFYLTAKAGERARRRQAELQANGAETSLEQIQKAIEERDKSDEDRAVGPLKPADDAIVVDTTDLKIDQVVEKLLRFVKEALKTAPEKKTGPLEQPKEKAPGEPKMRWFRFARGLCGIFCRLLFRIRVHGIENVPAEGPFVLVSNHQSFLDPLFCGTPLDRPLYFLARDTLFRKKFFGPLISSVNAIPVARGTPDLSAIKTVISKLKQGRGVCLFPEATRTRDGKISAFKPGFGLICRRGQAAVVPVVIDGAFECWPRHKKIFSVGSEITVRYGQCIAPEQVKKMNDRQLAQSLTDTVRRMQNDCHRSRGKDPQ